MLRTTLVFASCLCLFGARLANAEQPQTRVLAPGFSAQPLPVTLTNANALSFGPNRKLYVLGYDGKVRRLVDTDGDGLEDHIEMYWDRDTLISPIAMVWSNEGLYISSHLKVSLLRDTNNDGTADHEEIVATGWPRIPTGSNLIDVMGLAIDRDGRLLFGLGCADFTNAYLIKEGKAHYSRTSELGTILRATSDPKKHEIIATGLRFTYALKFNQAGDLFATDQEGETWLKGANPLDEVNHIQPGRHYGWPPRHPQHLPDVIDEPAAVSFSPQHASACGMVFNEPRDESQNRFGPAAWQGDAFVALYSRGRVNRVRLVKTAAGYVGQSTPFATFDRMPTDVAISPDGALYVALHSGQPDWGTGPSGQGHIVRITYADANAPQAIAAWPSGPLDVRVAFDRPIDAGSIPSWVGTKIGFGAHVRAGDRVEHFKPPYKAVEQQQTAPHGTIAVAAARLEDQGRTLMLTTDPMPWDATYAFALPNLRAQAGLRSYDADLAIDMRGVVATWEPRDDATASAEWWPHIDLDVAKRLTTGSAPHDRGWARLASPGRVTLRTRLRMPKGKLALRVATAGSIDIDEAILDGLSPPIEENRRQATMQCAIEGFPVEFELSLRTGVNDSARTRLNVTYHTDQDPTERPFRLDQLVEPWAPEPPPEPSEPSAPPPSLAGGNAKRGAAIFASDEAKCASCHVFRGVGKQVGPDLSNLHERDVVSVYRDIAEPSATINPDYVPYALTLKDGRVLAGIVRAEGEDSLRITDTNSETTVVKRSEIEELRPSATSIMPVGLAGALGEQNMRDLMAYLVSTPKESK